MKKVMGGVNSSTGGVCGGSCIGSVGDWSYVPENGTLMGCLADIQRYCRSGQGTCSFNCGGGEMEI